MTPAPERENQQQQQQQQPDDEIHYVNSSSNLHGQHEQRRRSPLVMSALNRGAAVITTASNGCNINKPTAAASPTTTTTTSPPSSAPPPPPPYSSATNSSSSNGADPLFSSSSLSSPPPTDGVGNYDIDGNNDNDLTSALLPPRAGKVSGANGDGGGNNNEDDNDSGWNQQQRQQRERQYGTARRVMRRAGNYLAYATLLGMLVVIPWVIYNALSNRQVLSAAADSAAVMVIGVVILSSRQVYLHLTHWYMPEAQKYVVRILFMVPIYAVQSWLSLKYGDARIYIDAIRDLYEAFVIASFVYYLVALLGGQEALVHTLRRKGSDPDQARHVGKHTFPLNLILQRWELGLEFMLQCKHGVLQYVVFKACSTVLIFLFGLAGVYGEGEFRWDRAYPYMAFVQNLSVMYALYCLVMLFHACQEELAAPVNWHPLGKFLCVKGVVFFTWWQAQLINYLRAHGYIGDLPGSGLRSEEVAAALINYCIVVEMVGFAVAHSYTFTHTEYLPSNLPADYQRLLQRRAAAAAAADDSEGHYYSERRHHHDGDAVGGGGGGPCCGDGGVDDDHCDDDPDGTGRGGGNNKSTYRPPATLHQPMRFSDALWSSATPHETLQDIRRLRTGVDEAMQEARKPASVSLTVLKSSGSSQTAAAGGSGGSSSVSPPAEGSGDNNNRNSEQDNAAPSRRPEQSIV